MKRLLGLAAIAAVVVGCATGYQPAGLAGGFTETQLDSNVWRVSFQGNGYTRGEKVEDFAMLRSAELALQNGFTHFAFLSSKTGGQAIAITAPTTTYTTSNASVYGNNVSGTATSHTYGGGTTFVTAPSAQNLVMMFKGKPNVQGIVYDAQFICQSLGRKYEVVCKTAS